MLISTGEGSQRSLNRLLCSHGWRWRRRGWDPVPQNCKYITCKRCSDGCGNMCSSLCECVRDYSCRLAATLIYWQMLFCHVAFDNPLPLHISQALTVPYCFAHRSLTAIVFRTISAAKKFTVVFSPSSADKLTCYHYVVTVWQFELCDPT